VERFLFAWMLLSVIFFFLNVLPQDDEIVVVAQMAPSPTPASAPARPESRC
jgi:hypothetical protein